MDRKLLLSFVASLGLTLTACPADDEPGEGTDSGTDTSSTSTTTTTTTTSTSSTGTDTDDTTTSTSTSGTDTDGSTGGEAMASIRLIHASPGAGAVDVYVMGGDSPAFDGTDYLEAEDYIEVAPGDYVFEVYADGGVPGTDTPVFTTGTLTLAEGSSTTAVAVGVVGGTDPVEAFTVLALNDNFSDPGADNIAARLVHAGADAPAVDVDVGDDGDGTDSEVEAADFDFGDDTGEAGIALTAASFQAAIRADLDGGTGGTDRVTAFTTPDLTAGDELYIIATGLLGPAPRAEDGFVLLAVDQDSNAAVIRQNPTAYAMHASPDAGTVDVCLRTTDANGTNYEFDNVGYETSASVQVIPGEYAIGVWNATDGCGVGRAIEDVTVTLDAGERYVAAAVGEVSIEGDETGEQALQILAFAEEFTANDGSNDQPRVAAVHGASAVDVEIGIVDGSIQIAAATDVVFNALGFGDVSAESTTLTAGAGVNLGLAGDLPDDYPKLALESWATGAITNDTRLWYLAHGTQDPDTLAIATIDASSNGTLDAWTIDFDIND